MTEDGNSGGNSGSGALSWARRLAETGFNVEHAHYRTKPPSGKWVEHQVRRTDDLLGGWFNDEAPANFWIHTGAISGIVVLDCDNLDTVRWWDAKLGGILAGVPSVETSKGRHFYFRLTEELRHGFKSWALHNPDGSPAAVRWPEGSGREGTVEISFDLQANGKGVVAAGSVHPDGHRYRWMLGREATDGPRALSQLPEMPAELESAMAAGLRAQVAATQGGSDGNTRSMLTKLLQSPPTEGGRNNWLSRVAGHYAKEYRTRRDAYQLHCEMANERLSEPLSPAEFVKTIDSIWDTEQTAPSQIYNDGPSEWDPDVDGARENEERERAKRVNFAGPESGWLMSADGNQIMCQTRQKQDGEYVYGEGQWADFDLVARGVVDDPEQGVERAYDVTVLRARQGDKIDALLYARDLADPRRLTGWCNQYGVTIVPPDEIYPKAGSKGERMTRYLEAQKPPAFRVVTALGWDDDELGFVCHEGVIRPDGLHPFGGVRPDPILRNRAEFRYGWTDEPEGRREARRILREILTFHFPRTAAVFGAWWAASLVKPLLSSQTAQFPIMAIEAPSESGKTKGMFNLLLQLSGSQRGQGIWTGPALRDAVASHNSGIAWLDDQDDLERHYEMLRSATGDGSVTKKAEDRMSQVAVKLLAPILLTGESLGLDQQKALRDRCIQLAVDSPTGRKSLSGSGEAQWSDILSLTAQYPDLSVLAGNVVALALDAAATEATPAKMARVRGAMSGKRVADKLAILRIGSRILTSMTNDPSWADLVDQWIDEVELDDVDANTVELKLIPAALAIEDFPNEPKAAQFGRPATPVYITMVPDPRAGQLRLDGTSEGVGELVPLVHVSPAALGEWWRMRHNGRIEQRTESVQAIGQQLKSIPGITRSRPRVGGQQLTYWTLPLEHSQRAVERARGN